MNILSEIKIFDAEYKFMNLVWENEPIKSTEMVKLAKETLNWKKSTTYTVIRRLSERNIIKNENTYIHSLVNKQQVMIEATKGHIDKIYNGSLKLFFNTFLCNEKLSKKDIDDLKEFIDNYDEN